MRLRLRPKGLLLAFLVGLTASVVPTPAGAWVPTYSGSSFSLNPKTATHAFDLEEPIALVAVTWKGAAQGETSVRHRSGGIWSDWQELEVESSDGKPGVISTHPLWVGRADAVEVGLPPGAVEPKLNVVKEDGWTRLPGSQQAHAVGDAPRIFTRAEWGARPATEPPQYGTVQGGIIHHTAGTNDYSLEQVPSIIRAIQAYNMDSPDKDFRDIGYNFLLDRFGRVWEGREGGVDRAVIGAHSQGFNSKMTGISVLGNYVDVDPSPLVNEVLSVFMGWKLPLHGVDPAGRSTIVSGGSNKWPAGTDVHLWNVSGHQDVAQTACPARIYGQLDAIRARASALGAWAIPYPGFLGGIFTAAGDLDGSGFEEVVTGAGEGGGPHIKVYGSGADLRRSFFPYDSGFTGGVRVAVGNSATSGRIIVTGAGPSGGPHVRLFNPAGNLLSGFFAYDVGFTGGVYVGAGNIDGLPGDEIVTGAGAGGGPHVRVFNSSGSLIGGFFPYDPGFSGGVRVATGDVDGIPGDEIVTAPGPGGGPEMTIWKRNVSGGFQRVSSFFAYDWRFGGGVYPATLRLSDGKDYVVSGAGEGGGPHVRTFHLNGAVVGEFFFLRPELVNGVRVAGGIFESGGDGGLALTGGPGSFPMVRLNRVHGNLVGS